MSLTDTDKIVICQTYDTLLSKKKSFVSIMGELSPNLINFNNYNLNSGKYHIQTAYSAAESILKKRPRLDRGEILSYIANPDFEVLTDANNNALNTQNNSLEDSIITRQLEEQIIIEPKQTVPKKVSNIPGYHFPITKVSKLNLGTNLFYISEDVIFVPEKLYYELLRYLSNQIVIQKNIPATKIPFDQNFKLMLWQELIKTNYPKFKTMPDNIYTDLTSYTKNFHKFHLSNVVLADFVPNKEIAFDNRKHSPKAINENNSEGVLTLVHQRMFKKRP